jgi:hypothetical protein
LSYGDRWIGKNGNKILIAFRLGGEAWLLLQIGQGGYVVGRSGEKIVERMK